MHSKNWLTCEEADDQADQNDCEAAESTVPHVGQRIKSVQPRRFAEGQREMINLSDYQKQKLKKDTRCRMCT